LKLRLKRLVLPPLILNFLKMISMRTFLLILSFQFIAIGICQAQFEPKIDVGSTAFLQYEKSGGGDSPLAFNDGNKTFFVAWDLLMGVQINENLGMFAEVQSQQGQYLYLYALSMIYKPESKYLPRIEFGKFQAPFGNFLKRRWANINPLSNFPLIYNYRVSLSNNFLPPNSMWLLRQRGNGQGIDYAVGSDVETIQGLRILSRYVYLTGLQIFGGNGVFSYNLGVTNGSLSTPDDINANDAINLVARLSFNPFMGLELGTSFASGAYLNSSAVMEQFYQLDDEPEDFRQTTFGVDVAYSIGHVEFFGEGLFNRWQTPLIDDNLDAVAFQLELKYSFFTRYFIAGRFSRIDFSEIDDAQDVDADGNLKESWEFDVSQYEIGIGYDINRNFLFKLFKSFNTTYDDPADDPSDNQIGAQVVLSF